MFTTGDVYSNHELVTFVRNAGVCEDLYWCKCNKPQHDIDINYLHTQATNMQQQAKQNINKHTMNQR